MKYNSYKAYSPSPRKKTALPPLTGKLHKLIVDQITKSNSPKLLKEVLRGSTDLLAVRGFEKLTQVLSNTKKATSLSRTISAASDLISINSIDGYYQSGGVNMPSSKHFKINDGIYNLRDSIMSTAKDLYGLKKFYTFEPQQGGAQLTSSCGFNQKGVFCANDEYHDNGTPSEQLCYQLGFTTSDYRKFLVSRTQDFDFRKYTSEIDFLFCIHSKVIEIDIYNLNPYLPTSLTLFRLKNKSSSNYIPPSHWFNSESDDQSIRKMSSEYTYPRTRGSTDTTDENTYITSSPLHYMSTPFMSTEFREKYSCEKVFKLTLDAGSSLRYTFKYEYGKPYCLSTHLQDCAHQSTDGKLPLIKTRQPQDDISFLLTHSGSEGILRRNISGVATPPLQGILPSSISVKTTKWFEVNEKAPIDQKVVANDSGFGYQTATERILPKMVAISIGNISSDANVKNGYYVPVITPEQIQAGVFSIPSIPSGESGQSVQSVQSIPDDFDPPYLSPWN